MTRGKLFAWNTIITDSQWFLLSGSYSAPSLRIKNSQSCCLRPQHTNWPLTQKLQHRLYVSAAPGAMLIGLWKASKKKKKGTQSSGIESRCLVWMLHCRRTKQTRTWASNLTSGFCAGEPRHLLDSSPLVSVVRFCLKHHQLVRFSGVVTYFQLTAITAILKFLISQWAPLISSWLFPSRLH